MAFLCQIFHRHPNVDPPLTPHSPLPSTLKIKPPFLPLRKVGRARKQYNNVAYPTMSASEKGGHKDAKVFNCVQRAHEYTLEFLPLFMAALLLGGLQYPLVAAVLGAVYSVARIQYFQGYSIGLAQKRFFDGGVLILPAYFGLLICTICFTLHQFFPDVV